MKRTVQARRKGGVVTIREVAATAGVSVASVSYALHQPERLRAETRQRVLQAVRQLGYVPNLAASLLRSRAPQANSLTRRLSIGFITAEQTEGARRGPTLGEQAARSEAERLGYGLERFDLALQSPGRRFTAMLRARGVAGLLFGPNYQPELLEAVDWTGFAGVCLSGYPGPVGLHRVRSDAFLQLRLAWRQLWARGYRRIGAVLYQHCPRIDDDDQRLGAFLALQTSHGTEATAVPPLLGSPPDPEEIARWWKTHHPEAVIDAFCQVGYVLRDLGVRVPEDTAVVYLYSTRGQGHGPPAMVQEALDDVATAAVGLLDQILRHHTPDQSHCIQDIRIPPRWIEGTSVRPLPV